MPIFNTSHLLVPFLLAFIVVLMRPLTSKSQREGHHLNACVLWVGGLHRFLNQDELATFCDKRFF